MPLKTQIEFSGANYFYTCLNRVKCNYIGKTIILL